MRTNQFVKNGEFWMAFLVVAIAFVAVLYSASDLAMGAPQGAQILSSTTQNASVRAADSHTAQGGSFTTLLLNVTSQTSKWKAYVGNVTGRITLDNSNNQTIYDWAVSAVQGEVYVSRNESVDFTSMVCANAAAVNAEQSALGINGTSDDSINNTFKQTIHKSFTIGGTGLVSASSCPSIATYLNDTSQAPSVNATFQEVLMSDGAHMVYVSLLENKKSGFDTTNYDFQMLVPDDPTATSTTYYFYAELG